MKISWFCALLVVAVLSNGCALFHRHQTRPPQQAPVPLSVAPAAPAASNTNTPAVAIHPIITPDNSLTAQVVAYNATGRFVVLTFPVGQMPKMDQTMFLYRNGLKVGEIKITGPQNGSDIVADLVTGTAQMGDEVRDQ